MIPTDPARLPTAPGPIHAAVRVPGSKSITNRALLVAALAAGESELTGALFSDDTHYMSAALRQAGIGVEADPERGEFRVQGGRAPGPVPEPVFLGNAGTAMRFLTSFFTLGRGAYVLDGSPRMRERPIQDLVDALVRLGARVHTETGCPPVTIQAPGLLGGATSIPGAKSSQYLSSLLLTAPYAEQPVEIQVTGELTSRPYIDLTLDVMAAFGVQVESEDHRILRVQSARYRERRYAIEPDASTASYFLAAAAVTGGRITVQGLSTRSRQGDIQFVRLLEQMGCTVRDSAEGLSVEGTATLQGLDVDMNACSDVSLTLAALAPFCSSPTHVRNIAHVRLQETDRIHAIVTELRRCGVQVEERPDGFSVFPSDPRPTIFDTHDDHRIAMSLSLIGLRVPGCAVRNPGCVSKTFPEFWEVWGRMVGC